MQAVGNARSTGEEWPWNMTELGKIDIVDCSTNDIEGKLDSVSELQSIQVVLLYSDIVMGTRQEKSSQRPRTRLTEARSMLIEYAMPTGLNTW